MSFRYIGFGLQVSWLWMFILEGPLLGPVAALWQVQPNSLFLLFLGCHSLGFFLGFKRLDTQFLLGGKKLLRSCTALMFLCPVLMGGIPLLSPEMASSDSWIAYCLTAVSGLAAAPFVAAWLESFTLQRVEVAAMMFAGAITIAGSFTLLGGVLEFLPGMMILAIMPLISLIFLEKQVMICFNREIRNGGNEGADPFSNETKVRFALFYIAGGLMFKIVTLEQTFPYLFCVANVSYVVVSMAAGLLLYHWPQFNLSMLYRPTLPLLGVGFLLFFSRWNNEFAVASFLLLQAGFALFDMYTWLLITRFARNHSRPAAVCCKGLFLITVSIFSGNMAFTVLSNFTEFHFHVELLALMAGILSLLAALVFPDRREDFSRRAVSVVLPQPENDVSATIEMIRQREQMVIPDCSCRQKSRGSLLTERENEVLLLLLRGRSARVIGENLNVSPNTVKFHIKNIYEKAGVSNRQELLDTYEKY